MTAIFSHILIGLSLLFIEDLKKIPRPVLDGLFLYLAITALHSNQLFERIMLLVTEQASFNYQITVAISNSLLLRWSLKIHWRSNTALFLQLVTRA